jgi:hypothetical protein
VRDVPGWSTVSRKAYARVVGVAKGPRVSFVQRFVQAVVNIKISVECVVIRAPRYHQVLPVVKVSWVGFPLEEFVVVLASTAIRALSADDA